MSSKRTEELVNLDRKYIIHPLAIGGQSNGIVFEKAYGIMLQDTEGKEYFDASSQLMCVNLGHGRKELIDAAVEQMSKSQYTTQFMGYGSPPTIDCAQKLAKLVPEGLSHFHFVDGGSEAIDTAVKFARMYWHRQGKGDKYKTISLYQSYHGVSGGSTNLTSLGWGRFWEAPTYIAGIIHIPTFYCYRCMFGLNYPDCDMRCARFLGDIIDSEGAESVSAFLAEPIQGSAGIIAPPPEYWPMVRKICTDHDVLLIGDEVMTGFARTGKMFALEHWNVKPDIMTMAKGITSSYCPFGAVAINDKVFAGLKDALIPGFTFSGHPVCAAVSAAAMDVYIKERVVENAAKVGKHIRERLDAEFMPLPCVGDISGMGCFFGIELVTDKNTKTVPTPAMKQELEERFMRNGLYLRIRGTPGTRLALCPPCTTTIEEADKILDTLHPILVEFCSEITKG